MTRRLPTGTDSYTHALAVIRVRIEFVNDRSKRNTGRRRRTRPRGRNLRRSKTLETVYDRNPKISTRCPVAIDFVSPNDSYHTTLTIILYNMTVHSRRTKSPCSDPRGLQQDPSLKSLILASSRTCV